MKKQIVTSVSRFLALLCCFALASAPLLPCSAQESSESQPEKQAEEVETNGLIVVERTASLQNIHESIERLRVEIKAKQRALRSPEAEGQREELTAEIRKLSEELRGLEANFKEISSGVDLEIFESDVEPSDVSWGKELKDLVSPVLSELKDVTSAPREIDRLQTEIGEFQRQISVVDQALENLEKLRQEVKDKSLLQQIDETKNEWVAQRKSVNTKLAINSQKLEQRLSERKTFSESVEHLFEVFFQRRGRNLIVAILITILFWVGLGRFYRTVEKVSPLHRKQQSFAARLSKVLYLVLMILGTAIVFLAVLYFFGDWVLLILAVMLLVGLLWASKQAIPRSWNQAMLLLNMGPVREHERVIYNDLPWRVRKVNFYTEFENPELAGGKMRLPIHDLMSLRSRPCTSDEPWFPTHANDWVVLENGDFGKVVHQSPESVRLIELGGAQKTYQTSTFLSTNPKVLSRGFRIESVFGVDYQHQGEVSEKIPELLEAAITMGMDAREYSKDTATIRVEFAEAGASSLNLAVLADFKGEHASDYKRLSRLIQRLSVDCCNEHGWTIPFEQLTLHVANPPK